MTRLEHFNITVPDIDAALEFLKIVAPDYQVRKDAQSSSGFRWVHIGNTQSYLALQEPNIDSCSTHTFHETYKNFGFNHIGLVVENLATIEDQLLEKGYNRGILTPTEMYRKRAYFFDAAGFEWELTEYLSDDFSEMYLYE